MSDRSDSAFTIGKVAGAPLRIGPGSVLIGAYIAYSLGQQWADRSSTTFVVIAAILTGVAFLASIVAHELGHAIVAKRNQIRLIEIRLTLFGGAAALERGAPDPVTEMKVAAAGPAVNLGIAGVGLGLGYGLASAGIEGVGLDALVWVSAINLILGVFNLLPGLPLDGGSVLAGFLWKRRQNRASAIRTTVRIGRGLGVVFLVLGAFQLFVVQSPFGLYAGFLGYLFLRGGQTELARAELVDHVAGRTVADVTRFQPPVIDEESNTATARALLPSPQLRRWAIVRDAEGVARGLLDLIVLNRAADADGTNSVADVMVPIDQRRAAYANEPLGEVLSRGVFPPFVVIDDEWRPVGLVDSISEPPVVQPGT